MNGRPKNNLLNLAEHGGVHVHVARHAVLVRRRAHPRRRWRRLRRKHLLHPHTLIQVSCRHPHTGPKIITSHGLRETGLKELRSPAFCG